MWLIVFFDNRGLKLFVTALEPELKVSADYLSANGFGSAQVNKALDAIFSEYGRVVVCVVPTP